LFEITAIQWKKQNPQGAHKVEYCTKEEIRRLFTVARERNPRHHLFLATALFHGARVSEAINIRGTDICDGQLSIRRLKRSNATIQPIHKDEDPLFDCSPVIELARTNPGRLFPFSRQRADQFIKKYGALAGIHPDKRHSHCVGKHSMAMLLWDATHDLGQIQSYLGHKSPGSTLCYLRQVDENKAHTAVAGIRI
jgi:integrase